MSVPPSPDDSLQKLLTNQKRSLEQIKCQTVSQVRRLADARLAYGNKPLARHAETQLKMDGSTQRSRSFWFDRR